MVITKAGGGRKKRAGIRGVVQMWPKERERGEKMDMQR